MIGELLMIVITVATVGGVLWQHHRANEARAAEQKAELARWRARAKESMERVAQANCISASPFNSQNIRTSTIRVTDEQAQLLLSDFKWRNGR